MIHDYPVQVFHQVSLEPPLKLILARLGYHTNMTVLTVKQEQEISQVIREGVSYCLPQACYVRVPLKELKESRTILENGLEFESKSLQKVLGSALEVVVMAATVGPGIIEKRDAEVKKENGSRALILDAVASEMADAVLDWLTQYMNTMVRRESKRLTRTRFSPGYGDLSLENQVKIFDLLDLKSLGLSLTPTCILVPEKSVTALAGLEQI